MDTILYLYKHTFANRVKTALKKPVTYVWAAFILLYCIMIPFSFKVLVDEFQMNSPQGMAAFLTAMGFWIIPVNLISYAKRKGLLYTKSDVHFLFPAPVSPKMVLLYAHIKGLFLNILINIIGSILGAFLFQVDVWRMLIYFSFSLILENLLESALMLFIYGSEMLGDKGRKLIVVISYGLLAALVVIALVIFSNRGLSFDSVLYFLHSDAVKMVPVIGWYVAVIHWIFMGPTTMTLIGSALYGVFLILLLVVALRMKCTGEFYEDAMTFADDYAEIRAKQKAGSTEMMRIGKKTKYGKANVSYKGTGAKAIFYRQLLEYKKSRFFIFDVNTIASIGGAALMIYLNYSEGGFGEANVFVIPGLMAYLIFLFTNMSGKWGKELKYAYTYLIPDSPVKKLFYATLMQLIQAAINGALLAVPLGIVLGYHPVVIVLCIVAYVVLSAAKLYALAVTELLVGNVLGATGKQFFHLLLEGIVIGFGIAGAVIGALLGGEMLAYILMIVFVVVQVIGLMVIAAMNFDKMEAVA